MFVIFLQVLKRQCVWFNETRLVAKCFIHWQSSLTEKLIENEKTNVALYHWSLALQYRVLTAWRKYTLQRRSKRERVVQALELRRDLLLRKGCAQMMAVSSDLKAMRQKVATDHGAEVAIILLTNPYHCLKN